MEYIICFLLVALFVCVYLYFFNRELQYIDFYGKANMLCNDYNHWQILKGKSYLDGTLDSAFDFCRAKFPLDIPLSLYWSLKPINMDSLFTDEMKQKFEIYFNDINSKQK